jgi:hypothetical protein
MAIGLPPIVDAHIHLSGRKDDCLIPYARRNGLAYTLPELLRLMKANGVARGLLLSPPLASKTPLPNKDVIRLCAKSGGVLSPIVTVTPTASGVTAALAVARKNRGVVKGFKVLLGYVRVFAHDEVFHRLYDFAEKEKLPVMFHTGDMAEPEGSLVHSHPLTLDSLANARPRLKVVACHFGNPWMEDVAELIYKHPNVYADISGLAVGGSRYFERYTEFLARRLSEAIYYAGGAEKVLFGTDYPVTTYRAALTIVAKLNVDDKDMERILWRNASGVFSL